MRIFQMTWKTSSIIMLWAFIVNLFVYHHYISEVAVGNDIAWYASEIRHMDDPWIEVLDSIAIFWDQSLSLGIFTLSFFVNQAYEYWKRVYNCSRAIQGRINDLSMLVTACAARSEEYGEVNGTTGYQTKTINSGKVIDPQKLVSDVTRMLRMSHAFFWAATPTASDGLIPDFISLPEDFDPSKVGPRLLSREGLETLVRCNQLTQNEMDALIATNLSPSQYYCILMEWALIRCVTGLRSGELVGSQGLEDNILKYFTQLRGEYANIGDFVAGRMAMAYVIAVEVIVDLLVLVSPLALFVRMGALSIPACGLITLSFKGLLEMSKSFLDTFGIEGYSVNNIRVDVLVSETNFGASQRWVKAGDMLPSIKDKSSIE